MESPQPRAVPAGFCVPGALHKFLRTTKILVCPFLRCLRRYPPPGWAESEVEAQRRRWTSMITGPRFLLAGFCLSEGAVWARWGDRVANGSRL